MVESLNVGKLTKFNRSMRLMVVFIIVVLLLGSSDVAPGDQFSQVRQYTRGIEFNYINWILNALQLKLRQSSLGVANYISSEKQHEIIVDYLETVRSIHQIKAELNAIYSDPKIEDPEVYSQDLRIELEELSQQNRLIKPHAEDILQSQISNIVADFGLTYGGQPVPPVLYHNTTLPLALIISPRDVIRQEMDISLKSDLSLEQQIELEEITL